MRPVILALTLVLSNAVALPALAQGRPAGVQTAIVETSRMVETVTVFGQIVAERESAVATRVAGVVAEVPIRVGAAVAEGDVLARMDTELLRIELARAETELSIAEAGVGVADARLDRAEKAFRRAEDLAANSTIAAAQLEDREGLYTEALSLRQEAEARISTAHNAIDQARYRLDNATIRAPFDGIVLEVTTEIGQFASIGSQMAALLDLGSVEVEANVPARLIGGLVAGAAVDGRTDTGGALALSVRAILPTEFSSTRTRPVRFELTGDTAGVAVGQSVTLDVPTGPQRDVVVVPKDALVQARGGWSAFVNDGGKASPRTVEIGNALGDRFEVLSGLAPGDEVVVRGNERLRPGQDIAPMGGGGPGGPGGGRPPGSAEAGDGDSGALPADEDAPRVARTDADRD